MSKKIGFYKLYNTVTNEFYIGSGILEDREKSHFYKLRNGIHENYKLQKAFNRNSNFIFIPTVIDKLLTIRDNRNLALIMEQKLIDDSFDNIKCLNIARDVDVVFLGRKHNDKTIEKMSISKKEKWIDPNFQEKMSISMRAGWQKLSKKQKEIISKINSDSKKRFYADGRKSPAFGQKRTEEFKKLNKDRVTELWKNPKFREKNLQARKGKIKGFPSIKVEINGIIYESITKAADELNMSVPGVIYRCDSLRDKFSRWKIKRRTGYGKRTSELFTY